MRLRLGVCLLQLSVAAALPAASPAQELWPGTAYDPAIPTLQQVLGHDFGDAITPPEGIARYLAALAAAAPDRTQLLQYATTWEGRPLHLLVVARPDRIAALDAVKRGLQRLADPRLPASPDALAPADLPVVIWLMHAVHGNEISSSDAALAEAYHLLAARGDAGVDEILRESIVLIDPLQNPDGRARFVTQNLLGRAATPDPAPWAAERDEPWPGGRANHYLFDMNRDWFAQTQPETQGRLRIALEWQPHVVVDLHEMSGESTYYFPPPADPVNPFITTSQNAWFETFGRANAARFDERGFPYFVRERYDSFYPGYGESWPIFQGAIGMTYEQASARGLVYRREDGSLLTYRHGVIQHFTAAVTTLLTAARNRAALLRDYAEYRRSAIAEGEKGVREYLLVPGVDPSRARHLAARLASQGIEVRVTAEPVTVGGRTLPAGTYAVSAAQPSGRLVRNLLETHVAQPEPFVQEQDRRRQRRMPDQFYDLTAWSLPLLYDVQVVTADRPVSARTTPLGGASAAAPAGHPRLGYLSPWGSDTARVVAEALTAGVKVRQASRPFSLGGREYGVGTAIIRAGDNTPEGLTRFAALAAAGGVELVPLESSWVDEGISLGSEEVASLRAPRVLLAWDTPTSSLSAGWARYVLEQRFRQPATAVRVSSLGRVELPRYDVLVLPAGDYADAIGEEGVRRIKEWVRAGGTLITLGEASRWAVGEKVGLLETHTELRDGRPESREPKEDATDKAPATPFDLERAITPERERPESTPGAILRVSLDQEHWLTAGHDGQIQAIVQGRRVFAPLKLDKGRNVGLYEPKDTLVASGLVWDDAREQLAQKAYLMHQPLGRGHVVAFAEDPNYRAFSAGTELLFINAVLLGPAY